ncbi:MAG: hypothetical protein JW920_05320 [Deltaproteobacteria bacterium]|nr:hypothetical protein [Deltaproteobacteria bacterium]
MEEHEFAGGVRVIVEDKTKNLSGDLYMVRLEFSIILLLDDEDHELLTYCGDHIRRTRVFEKPAVCERDLEQTKKGMKQSFFETINPYFNHPEFARRLKNRTRLEMHEEDERRKRRVHE